MASSARMSCSFASVAGLLGTIAQYSPTLADRSWVPTRFDSAMISSLLFPISGRRIGSGAPSEITERFWRVWEETCPIASPVTMALASQLPAMASAARSMSRFSTTCQ